MANEQLRQACADILRGLAGQRGRDPRSAGRLLHGARMIEHAELLTYGEPVPADEVDALVEAAVEEARENTRKDSTVLSERLRAGRTTARTTPACYSPRGTSTGRRCGHE
jgi:hypothetical protein